MQTALYKQYIDIEMYTFKDCQNITTNHATSERKLLRGDM